MLTKRYTSAGLSKGQQEVQDHEKTLLEPVDATLAVTYCFKILNGLAYWSLMQP